MSKKRVAGKFAAAGAVSAVYLIGANRVLTTPQKDQDKPPLTRQQVVTGVGVLLGLTWLATLL